MSKHSLENPKTTIIRILSFHFGVGNMKTAIIATLDIFYEKSLAKHE